MSQYDGFVILLLPDCDPDLMCTAKPRRVGDFQPMIVSMNRGGGLPALAQKARTNWTEISQAPQLIEC
jgi:hypothetical protein